MSSRGADISARPMASICCWPPDSDAARCAAAFGQEREEVEDAVEAGLPVGGRSLAGEGRDLEVLLDAEVGKDPPPLGHVHDTGPHPGRSREAGDVLPVER